MRVWHWIGAAVIAVAPRAAAESATEIAAKKLQSEAMDVHFVALEYRTAHTKLADAIIGCTHCKDHLVGELFRDLGIVLAEWGKSDAADKAFARAIALDPAVTLPSTYSSNASLVSAWKKHGGKLIASSPSGPPTDATRCHENDDAAACLRIGELARACVLGHTVTCGKLCVAGDYDACEGATDSVRAAHCAKAATSSLPKLVARCVTQTKLLRSVDAAKQPVRHKLLATACSGSEEIVESAVAAATGLEPVAYTAKLADTKKAGCTCDDP